MRQKQSLNSDVTAGVTADVLACRLDDEHERFRKIGSDAFLQVVSHVSPAKGKLFTSAFDKLVTKHHCREEILFECLFLFCNAAIVPLPHSLPATDEALALRRDLDKVATQIRKFNDSKVIDALRDHTGGKTYFEAVGDAIAKAKGKSPAEKLVGIFLEANQEQHELLRLIKWYQGILDIWWVPQEDIIRTWGQIGISLYPKIANGAFDHETVAEILNCFNYQIESDALRENLTKFERLHSDPFLDLTGKLGKAHKSNRRELKNLKKFMIGAPPRIDWDTLFDPKRTKSHGAVAGKV